MTDVAVRNPAQELVARVRTDVFRDQVKLALPEGVSADRFTRVAITALQQNPDIVECDVDSVFSSLLRAAADGLLPDGREAALVSFNTKDKTTDRWVKKAQYMPMIAGRRKIAAEHGWIIRTDVVYANDDFDYQLGETPHVQHRPARLDMERGDPIGAYAVATHRDGRRIVEVMTRSDITKVRNVSRAKDKGPWVDWAERMWEKTVGNRIYSKLPLGERDEARMVRVIEASELQDGESAALLYGPNGEHSYRARELEGSGAEAAQPATKAEDSQHEAAPTAPDTPSEAAVGKLADSSAAPLTGDLERAASETDDDAEPQPPPAVDDPPKLAAALATFVPKREEGGKTDLGWAGRKLDAVDDPDWWKWALSGKRKWKPAFLQALILVAEHKGIGAA